MVAKDSAKKFVLVPDSFKGTLSATEICALMRRSIVKHLPNASVVSVPVADGGEGSVDAFFTALGGERVYKTVQGPLGAPVLACYLKKGTTAIIEMAAAAGLPLMHGAACVEKATTFGVGQLMLDAVENGAQKIILGIGGSATNDGGVGAACAMGVQFFDRAASAFVPVGETLCDIASYDDSIAKARLQHVQVIAMCDIDNVLCGPSGAAAIFGPQKGADAAMVQLLDDGLAHLAHCVQAHTGQQIASLPGAGAAGGLGAGAVAFFGAQLRRGIDVVLDAVNFDAVIQHADYILTGEGKLDRQSLRGKVVLGVARRARAQQVPVIAIVGDIGEDIEQVYEEGVSAVLSINRIAAPYQQQRLRAAEDLALTVESLLRVLAL